MKIRDFVINQSKVPKPGENLAEGREPTAKEIWRLHWRLGKTKIIPLGILGNPGAVSLERSSFKISNAERSEAKSGEAEIRSASPCGHYAPVN